CARPYDYDPTWFAYW
nr:immunoglobulin heavy chain junction region [Mus musculus]